MVAVTQSNDSGNRTHQIDPLWRMLSGGAIFFLGIFILGALSSYSPVDPSWNVAADSSINNLFDITGAIFADLSMQILGWVGWYIMLVCIIGGCKRTLLWGQPNIARWQYSLVNIPLIAIFLAGCPMPMDWPLVTGLGGLMGDASFYGLQNLLEMIQFPNPKLTIILTSGLFSVVTMSATIGIHWRDVQAASALLITIFIMLVRYIIRVDLRPAVKKLAQFEHAVINWLSYISSYCFNSKPKNKTRNHFSDANNNLASETLTKDIPESLLATKANPKVKAKSQRNSKSHPEGMDIRTLNSQNANINNIKPLPHLDLLTPSPPRKRTTDTDLLTLKAERLTAVLNDFGIRGHIIQVRPGPVITLFELEPAPGIKSSRVIALADDIARSMSASAARIAVVAGRNAIGIELPNSHRETVYLRNLLSSNAFRRSKSRLPLALGETIGGDPMAVDLTQMPHLLVAGTTGSGKSVGINAMILSLLYKLTPDQCRFIMIDPKMLELSVYQGIPHLLTPVVVDPKKAVLALKWTVREMESRYELMSKAGVRNLAGFNQKIAQAKCKGKTISRHIQTGFDEDTGRPVYEVEDIKLEHIPHIVVVIDEMADLMMVAGKEIEACIQRLAQMARAAGIHLITATQRPSVDVITGTIKANFPARISYMVTTKIDSRTILGEQGAEQLLGLGDLLFMAPGGRIQRLHGPFVSDSEVEAVVRQLKVLGEPEYITNVTEESTDEETSPVMDAMLGNEGGEEDLFNKAVAIVKRDKRASTSYIQRRLKIGYNRAASLIERLEDEGVISAPNHAGKREILGENTKSLQH